MRLQLAQHVAEHVARHHHQHVAAGRQRTRQIGFKQQGIGEGNVGQKRLIAAILLQRLNLRGVVPHSTTEWPLRASVMANAVPYEPAPMTVIEALTVFIRHPDVVRHLRLPPAAADSS